MATVTKPMLAIPIEDINKLAYPLLCSSKLDGIRCILINNQAKSRKFKPIPNRYIRNELEQIFSFQKSEIFDGEILSGNTFQDSSSNIMSFDDNPDFKYYIFDYVTDSLSEPYEDRMKKLEALEINDSRVIKLLPVVINSAEELVAFHDKCIAEGYEGVIARKPTGPYKCGRSTLREGYLLKYKQFIDSEATIIGFEELFINNNVSTLNNLGLKEKSSKKENLVGANTLGALVVTDIYSKKEFKVGSGFDDTLRQKIWDARDQYLGKLIKYKYFPIGIKDKPRIPTFLGIRDLDDLD